MWNDPEWCAMTFRGSPETFFMKIADTFSHNKQWEMIDELKPTPILDLATLPYLKIEEWFEV